jgi:transglutaminase-like putative cysteine protease
MAGAAPAEESEASAPPTFLETTYFLDWESEPVQLFTRAAVGDATESVDVAARIFAAVRDRVWYDPYSVSENPEHYRASYVAASGSAYCVPKAVLLTAVARAAGIPARLGFCDVRNHLQTPALRRRMGGSDLFVYHGYSELLLDGRWLKATPAFNRELCARFGVDPIEFDGRSDALLHQYSSDGARHMEYLRDHGWFADLPLSEILAALRFHYGGLVSGAAPHDTFRAPTSSQPNGQRGEPSEGQS